MRRESDAQRARLESRLTEINRKMDAAFSARLDGQVAYDVYQRSTAQWQNDADQLKLAIAGFEGFNGDRLLDAKRTLELANKAYSPYISQNPTEQAKLLKTVLLNCQVDGVSLYPAYRKPFDMICQRAKNEDWSGLEDDFRTFLATRSESGYLPQPISARSLPQTHEWGNRFRRYECYPDSSRRDTDNMI